MRLTIVPILFVWSTSKAIITLAQTPSPRVPTPKPTYPPDTFPVCYICGDQGRRVTKKNVILEVSGFVLTCIELEMLGLNGQFDDFYCITLEDIVDFHISIVCGCAPTEAPVAPPTFSPDQIGQFLSPEPTPVPTKKSPTKVPTSTKRPTHRPTKRPTRPTRPPTRHPTRRPTKRPTRRPTNRPNF